MTTKNPPAKKTPAKAKNSPSKRGCIQITGEGKYPLVETARIEIVERPEEGEDKLFFNPREEDSFTPESMTQLRNSIRSDGLQTPPLVRAFTDKDEIVKVELIAGERRLRSIQHIIEFDLPCFDEDAPRQKKYTAGATVVCKGHFANVISHEGEEIVAQILDGDCNPTNEQRTFNVSDVYPTVSGKAFYASIPCRVAYDITDSRALRLAFTENDKAKNLSTKEEIALVERLERRKLKVAEIAELLGTNETWVSQTSNFRKALPEEAFKRLLNGSMKRHVAVNIMGYKPADRKKLFEATLEAEAAETSAAISAAKEEAEIAEDTEMLALSDAEKLAKAGDTTGAKKATRAAKTAATKVTKARDKQARAESEAGQIKTSHIQKGASAAGLSPKKAKMLSKEEIEERYVVGLELALEGGEVDPICGEEIPANLAAIVRLTAMAILAGNRDPLHAIRSYMIEEGDWNVKTADEEDDEETFLGDDDDDDDESDDDDGPSDEDLEALDDEEYEDDDASEFLRQYGGNLED